MGSGIGTAQVAGSVLAALACWYDIRSHRIPNFLTLGGAVFAAGYALLTGGPAGLLTSALGWLTGCAVFLPFFLLGGMGAGDVKLLACLGAWTGPEAALWMALYSAIAGGVMAVCVSLATGYFRQAWANVALLLLFWHTEGLKPLPALTLSEGRGPRLPYAVPIAAGALAVIWLP